LPPHIHRHHGLREITCSRSCCQDWSLKRDSTRETIRQPAQHINDIYIYIYIYTGAALTQPIQRRERSSMAVTQPGSNHSGIIYCVRVSILLLWQAFFIGNFLSYDIVHPYRRISEPQYLPITQNTDPVFSPRSSLYHGSRRIANPVNVYNLTPGVNGNVKCQQNDQYNGWSQSKVRQIFVFSINFSSRHGDESARPHEPRRAEQTASTLEDRNTSQADINNNGDLRLPQRSSR